MKKLFLLFAISCYLSPGIAQEINSVMLPAGIVAVPSKACRPTEKRPMTYYMQSADRSSFGARTSSYVNSQWFNIDAYNQSSSAKYYYNIIFPDSTLYDAVNSFHTDVHGLGMSFDPTDSSYGPYLTGTYAVSPPAVDSPVMWGSPYQVDSFLLPYNYVRNNPTTGVVDSMIVDVFMTAPPDSGAYSLRFFPNASFAPICFDSTPRFGTGIYSASSSDFNTYDVYDSILTQKVRYAIPLSDGSQYDTTTYGYSVFSTAFATPFVVPNNNRRYHLVAFVHFVSGVKYTLGTNLTAANYLKLYTSEPVGTGWFPQSSSNPALANYPGSYQDGIWATNQSTTYVPDTNNFHYVYRDTTYDTVSGVVDTTIFKDAHNVLIPSYAYQTAPGFTCPDMAFHINWTNDYTFTSVGKVTANAIHASAYPNPANNTLSVSYDLAQQASVTVKLTNTVGQVVATKVNTDPAARVAIFNTSKIPSGVYFYTITANNNNNQQQNNVATGKVVIAH
jgi:Secretion system C-terminal sorting domain